MNKKSALVLGLGNPILGDDGVGWIVAEHVAREADRAGLPVEVDTLSLGGLGLMERLVGYRSVVLIDSLLAAPSAIGSVTSFPLEDMPDPSAGHSASAHDVTLATALNAGRQLGLDLPGQVQVVAIGIAEANTFTEELTPPVAAAVPHAARRALDLLDRISMPKEATP